MQKFRITFFINNINPPFTHLFSNFETASKLGNYLADFDLGRVGIVDLKNYKLAKSMISLYKKYLQSHGINHTDLIETSYMTIDQLDDFGTWWTISNNNEELEFELGEKMAFDTPDNAYENYL
jgi:hypothetical protein